MSAARFWTLIWLCRVAWPADLHPVALRILGQPRPFSNGWNYVEGRELFAPLGVAVDSSSSPPRLYVADTQNHRVLGWRDAAGFPNGAAADVVLGQPDRFGASPNSPSVAQGLFQPAGLAVDRQGNLWVADSGNHRVLRYPNPFLERVLAPDAVLGQPNFQSRDRNAGQSQPAAFSLAAPLAVAVHPAGDIIVADTGNHRVVVFSAGSLANQPASALVLDSIPNPTALALDAGGRLYVASGAANRVYQFPASLAPSAGPLRILGGNSDSAPRGPATLFRPAGLAVLGADLYVADSGNHRLLHFPGFARSAESPPVADAVFGQRDFGSSLPNGASPRLPLPSARSLSSPFHLAAGPNEELFVADSGNHRLLAVPVPGGQFRDASRILGQDGFQHAGANLLEGRELSTANPLATPAGTLAAAGGIAVDGASVPPHVYVADTSNHRVLGWRDLSALTEGARADLVIGQPDLFTAVPNFGTSAAESRPPSPSNLNRPSGLALDAAGNLYVADTGNHRILRFPRPFDTPAPAMPRADLILGRGSPGAAADLFYQPTGIALHPERGDLLVADTGNHRVLYFPAPLVSGMSASRVFGQASFSESSRGLSSAGLTLPTAVAFDAADNIYVADTGNSRILVFGPLRDLPAAGAAALATGPAPIGQPDFVTAAGAVAADRLRNPTGLAIDWATGDLWVADTGNHRVLRFPPLPVLALNGGMPYSSGGLFGQTSFTGRTPNLGAPLPGQTSPAGLNFPNALALDPAGNLLVGDANSRVLLFYPQAVSVSAATFLPGVPLAPGMLASLFGAGLSEETAAASDLPLPTALGGVQVLVEKIPAPLLYVSPGQINYQAPSFLEPGVPARLEVVRPGTGRVVAGGMVLTAPAAAGLFAVLNEDGSPNSAANPALRGSRIQIFATGQGMVRNRPPDGAPAARDPLAETPVLPVVTIGTSSQRDVTPEFSGLAPGFVGLWQINARVPEATAPGPRVPVLVRYAGSASNILFIAVR